MLAEYNPAGGAPLLHGQAHRLAIGWPLSISQAAAQPYLVLADGTRRPYGVEATVEPPVHPPAIAPEQPKYDLGRAWSAGAEMGRRYRGDPWRAARDEDLETVLVSPEQMARLGKIPAQAGHRVVGRLIGDAKAETVRIYVLATLPPAEQDITCAHEIAHWLHYGASETFCDLWAKGFCSQANMAGGR